MAGPETVIINTNLVGGGSAPTGANVPLLIAPHVQSGSLVNTNVIKTVKTGAQAAEFFGDGSVLHEAAKVALQNASRLLMVGMDKTNVASETYGDSNAVEQSSDTGADVLQNLPAWEVNSVTVDGGPALTIVYTHEALANMTPATGEIHINTKTGEWKLFGGEGTSGSGAGVIFDYDYIDLTSVQSAAESSAFEYVAFAGIPYSAQYFGPWSDLIAYATSNKNVVAAALESAVEPADVVDLVEATRNGRVMFLAADYSGDLTSALVAHRAGRPVNSTAKLQAAPLGITYSDTYRFADYGGAIGVGSGPDAGTFHHMGANAIYKTRAGSYRFSDNRSATATTDVDNFADIRRVIQRLEIDLDATLEAARGGSGVAIPYTQSGIELIALAIEGVLGGARQSGLIDQFFLVKPSISDFDANDRNARLMDGFDIKVVLAGQTHVIDIDLGAEV